MSEQILSVPYYSQHTAIRDEYWKERSCSVVCLAMVLDFYGASDIDLNELVKEGNDIGGFGQHGWIHDHIVFLAHNHGYTAYKEEFRTRTDAHAPLLHKKGILKIKRHLANERPVIVSAVKNFKDDNRFHTVVLTGYKLRGDELVGFYYHDPDGKDEHEESLRFVDIDTFKEKWRKMAIFVY